MIDTVPVKVSLPLRSKVPAPLLVSPCVPATTALIVAVSLLTVIVGDPVETASVRISAALPLLSRTQLLLGTASPNFSWPIVRALSRWTVSSAVMSSVLKSAMASVPLAMAPMPPQLALTDQSPPLVVSIHVPLMASAGRATPKAHKRASQILVQAGRTRRRPETPRRDSETMRPAHTILQVERIRDGTSIRGLVRLHGGEKS